MNHCNRKVHPNVFSRVGTALRRRRTLARMLTAFALGFAGWSAGVAGSPAFAASRAAAGEVVSDDVILLPSGSSLQVAERLNIRVPGRQAEDVSIPIPSGAEQVTVTNVPPGASSIENGRIRLHRVDAAGVSPVVTFSIPVHGQTSIQLTLHFDMAVDLMHIYVPIGNMALSAPGLMTQTETTQIAGTDFRVFTHGQLPAGSDYTLGLSVLPSVTQDASTDGLPVIGTDSQSTASGVQAVGNLVLAGAILVIALLGIRSTMARRRRTPEGATDALYQAWEDIEVRFARGQLDEVERDRRAAAIRRRLAEIRLSGRGGR
ncbi:MAG: hypothetical protein K6T78_12360 [Alicyclobacillus sp.]|nr:hypothetical protein [Alicyclobacillus sp.]